MLFNSFNFLVFLPIVYLLYWTLNKKTKYQNFLIVVASYVFYGFWDWRFLFLIFLSSAIDFIIGSLLESSKYNRKRLLYLSLTVNLGLLGFFKYYNFFTASFVELFESMGIHLSLSTINIVLPVGISFYTFQTLSYTIDVYKRNLKPTRDIVEFFAFVSFFPQLVAGPIERASHLLPQFQVDRTFNLSDLKNGSRQILAGLFKKIVIADNCSLVVDQIFENEYDHGLVLIAGIVLFAFQIYGDFSGYSDIGIGVARLFGFDLNRNFTTPYFSTSVREFWQRWHISLSTWFRDYVYIPLGGSKNGQSQTIVNLLITFTISGLWHGANYTFILWGFINGFYLVVEHYLRSIRTTKLDHPILSTIQAFITFCLINITWVFFRSESIEKAMHYLKGIATTTFEPNAISILHTHLFPKGYIAILLVVLLVCLEFIQRKREHFLDIGHFNFLTRVAYYFIIILVILTFGNFYQSKEFIYFQF